METKDFRKTVLKNGLLLGLLIVTIAVIQYATGLSTPKSFIINIFVFLLQTAIVIWFIATLSEHYKRMKAGFLSVSDAIKIGVITTLIAVVVVFVYSAVFYTMIEPNYRENALELARESLIEKNPTLTDEQIEQQLEIIKKFIFPWWVNSFFTGALGVLGGLIIGAIVGAVKKNEKTNY